MEYIDNTIFKINESIESLQEYRTRLITDVVTGKLDVRSIAATLPDIEDISLDIPTEEELEEEYIDEEE
jgi:type I restriction enzyme S subunit